MAVYIYPKSLGIAQLLQKINQWIEKEGSPTWALRGDKVIHTPGGQWDAGGYLVQAEKTQSTTLVFYYNREEGASPVQGTYGVYNGRFVQMLLNHFSKDIERVEVKDLRNS